MNYGRLDMAEYLGIRFPELSDYHMDDSIVTIVRSAAEEQVHGLGANPARRRKCRLGCRSDKTAYHVISASLSLDYNIRHDEVVYWFRKGILECTTAPNEISSQLKFGKASLVAEYPWEQRRRGGSERKKSSPNTTKKTKYRAMFVMILLTKIHQPENPS